MKRVKGREGGWCAEREREQQGTGEITGRRNHKREGEGSGNWEVMDNGRRREIDANAMEHGRACSLYLFMLGQFIFTLHDKKKLTSVS